MDEQPEALRLAEKIVLPYINYTDLKGAAAELCRLHQVNQELVDALAQWANAEATGDQIELENARTSRDAALTKHKEQT